MADNITLDQLAENAVPTAPAGIPTKANLNEMSEIQNLTEVAAPSTQDPIESSGNPMLDQAFKGLEDRIKTQQEETNAVYEKGLHERLEQDFVNGTDTTEIPKQKNFVINNYEDEQPVASTPDPEVIKELAKPVEVSTVAPVTGKVKKIVNILPDDETSTTDDKKSTIEDDINEFKGIEDMTAEDLKYLDGDDDTTTKTSDPEDNGGLDNEVAEAIKNDLRNEFATKFTPIHNKIDLSSFTVSDKEVPASIVMEKLAKKPSNAANSVIYSQKKCITMSAWEPAEIESINPNRVNESNYNTFISNKLKLIYEHIIDDNKPRKFEKWCALTPNTTMNEYMFAAYKATFGGANIVTYSCEDNDCNKVFMENVPISQMIKFRNDEIKEDYLKILHEGVAYTTEDSNQYETTLFQASDDYVFALKTPSLYNSYIEPTLVTKEFSDKYSDLLYLMYYIDAIYEIDRATNTLHVINYHAVPNDPAATYKRRVRAFYPVLKSLTSDQYSVLLTEVDKYDGISYDDDGNIITDVTYAYPERTCPKCGKKIPERAIEPDELLFSRHQLGLMSKI